MKRNIKNEMASFFSKFGILFNRSPRAIEKQLHRLMGDERYQSYLKLTEAVHSGEVPKCRLYEFVRTATEANVLMSHQSAAFLDVAAALYSTIYSHLTPGARIVDLGCFTGAFISWLASNHPECSFVGIDSNQKAIQFAGEMTKSTNAAFVEWDYAQNGLAAPIEPCDVLITTFGIDFDHSADKYHCSLDVGNLRNCDYYQLKKKEALPYFSCWRKLVTPEGAFSAILRIPGLESCLAIVDAAHETGWTITFPDSSHIRVHNERFPILTFQPIVSPPPNEDAILSWWEGDDILLAFDKEYKDPFAVVLFRALGGKVILQTAEKTFNDGHTMQKLIGTAGSLGFLFSRATTGYADLRLVPATQVRFLKISF